MKYKKELEIRDRVQKSYPEIEVDRKKSRVEIMLEAVLRAVSQTTKVDFKLPEKQLVEVSNFPEPTPITIEKTEVKFPEVQKVEVANFPKPTKLVVKKTRVKFPEVQKVEVTNQPQAKEIVFPKVQKIEVTNPTTEVTIQNQIPVNQGDKPGKADPTKYVPVRLTDGAKFYSAIASSMVSAAKTVFPFVNSSGKPTPANVSDHAGQMALDVHTPDMTISGSITGLNQSVEMELHGMGSALVQVGGVWKGKIDIQAAIDSQWATLSLFQPTGSLIRTGINNDAQNGLYRAVITAGYTKMRAIFTDYTSGTASILMNASTPVGSNQVWQLNPANLNATVTPAASSNFNVTANGTTAVSGTITASFNPANQSAFGTLETAELTPVIQGDWVYGINTQLWTTPVTSGTGAVVDTNSSRLRIQSGTSSTGYAYLTSRRPVRYRAGQGTVLRTTPLFTTGVANNIQLWGMGSIVSNAPYDGYFFGYNGTSFGIAHYIRGSATWYTRATDWNGDKVNGTAGTSFNWNPTTGVPIMIKYPYLGFGDIFFYVQHPTSGNWVLVHTIRYANTANTTQLENPTLQFIGYTANSGNTSNITMYCGSVGTFISGERSFTGNPKWGIDNNKTAITTETSILGIKNATTYNGVANRGLIRLNSISAGADAGKNVVANCSIRLKIGATLGGVPAYTPINGSTADNGNTITSGNSVASFDVAATTVANGNLVYNFVISEPGSTVIDLIPFDLYIAPGEVLSITGFSSASASITVALNWSEDI